MTIRYLVAGLDAMRAAGDGEFRARFRVPAGVGERLAVRFEAAGAGEPRFAPLAFELLDWEGRVWETTDLYLSLQRHSGVVQAYLAWDEEGAERDPNGLAEYRIQPFILPGSPVVIPEGGGLFERGFAWSDAATPAWIRMAALCRNGDPFVFRTYHAGFNEVGYAYCDRCSRAAIWAFSDETLGPLAASLPGPDFDMPGRDDAAEAAYRAAVAELDRALAEHPCRCEGTFRYHNPFRCPVDGAVYVDLSDARRRAGEYYWLESPDRPAIELTA